MKLLLAIALVLVMASFSFAGACPAGASDCFLCGGTNGIPCAQTDACKGHHDSNSGLDIACACPQGKPCACYCPYSQYGAQKDVLTPSDDKCAGCVLGCTADKSICITAKAEDIAAPNGPAEISAYDGEVLVSKDGGSNWARAAPGMRVDYGYMLKTGVDSRLTLLLDDGCKIYMDPDTTLNTKELQRKNFSTLDVVIEIMKGAIFSDVTKREGTKFELETGVSVAGVQGTQFSVSYDPVTKESVTKTYEGTVSVTSASGTIQLAKNQMVTVTESGAGQVSSFTPTGASAPPSGGGGCGGAAILLSVLLLGSIAARAD
jgi:hypothetical protein